MSLRAVLFLITHDCTVNIGPTRTPQYSYSGTSGYGDWRSDYTRQQTYRPASRPPTYHDYTAGLDEDQQIAEATRQSLRNGEHYTTITFNNNNNNNNGGRWDFH